MSEAALPTITRGPSLARREPSAEWLRAAGRVRALSWLSLAWMGVEGAIAITAGVVAGSIALIGFGLDSTIEGVASLVIVWSLAGNAVLGWW